MIPAFKTSELQVIINPHPALDMVLLEAGDVRPKDGLPSGELT